MGAVVVDVRSGQARVVMDDVVQHPARLRKLPRQLLREIDGADLGR